MQNHMSQQQLQIYCRNVVFIYFGLVILVALFGAWSILPTRSTTLGLQGTWSSKSHPNYSYEFRSNGRIDISFQGTAVKSFLTWERNGDKIWVMTSNQEASNVENWTFIGLLHAGKITGMASVRGKDGRCYSIYEETWVRDQAKETVESTTASVQQVVAIT